MNANFDIQNRYCKTDTGQELVCQMQYNLYVKCILQVKSSSFKETYSKLICLVLKSHFVIYTLASLMVKHENLKNEIPSVVQHFNLLHHQWLSTNSKRHPLQNHMTDQIKV